MACAAKPATARTVYPARPWSPGWISGCAGWPRSPPSTPPPAPKPLTEVSESGPAQSHSWLRGGAPGVNFPAASLHRAVTGQRKPSCPGWTAGACICVGKPPISSPRELAGTYGHIVIEDLDLAAMKRSMGRRAYRRAVSDAAMGLVGPMLAYKTARYGAAS